MENIPFSNKVAVLDLYIHSKTPGKDPQIATLIMESLKKDADLRRYFFTNRPDPAWVPLLWGKTIFFESPPDLEVTSQGTFVAFWEAHEYLCSIAEDTPDYLIKHINNLDPYYDWYKARAVKSLRKLPPEVVVAVIPKVCEWLNKDYIDWSLSNDASELMLFSSSKRFY